MVNGGDEPCALSVLGPQKKLTISGKFWGLFLFFTIRF
jgi:hypothetical protein